MDEVRKDYMETFLVSIAVRRIGRIAALAPSSPSPRRYAKIPHLLEVDEDSP
jgi:hypothetical protein